MKIIELVRGRTLKEEGGLADYAQTLKMPPTNPAIIPSPRGMGGDMDHYQQFGNMNDVRSGKGPTQIPPGGAASPGGIGPGMTVPGARPLTTTGVPMTPGRQTDLYKGGLPPGTPMDRMPNGDWKSGGSPVIKQSPLPMENPSTWNPALAAPAPQGSPNLVPGGAMARPAPPPAQPAPLPQVPQHGPNLESAKTRRRRI